MSVTARSAFAAVAFFATSFSLPILAPIGTANAAASCLAAPNAPAPQGSHWYYRLERPSLRKCWRLVQKDQKDQRAATPEPDDETKEAPAAIAPVERAAETAAKPAPAPVVNTLVTRNVSSTNEAAQPLLPPAPSTSAAQGTESANAPAPAQHAAGSEPAPVQLVDQPAPRPVVASDKPADASDPDGAPTWLLLLEAIALLGLLAGAACFVMWIVRRRTDVLNTVRGADGLPLDASPAAAEAEPPTFAPLPPISALHPRDDVDEALERFAQPRRRRAA